MTRRWEYLLFPSRAGALAVPSMSTNVFSPSTGAVRVIRCQATTLMVTTAVPEKPEGPRRSLPTKGQLVRTGILVALAAAGLLMVLGVWRAVARIARSRREVSALVSERTPEQIRDEVHARLTAAGRDPARMMGEMSECGDAYRALRSILDAMERDRIEFDLREVRARVRDFLICLQSRT